MRNPLLRTLLGLSIALPASGCILPPDPMARRHAYLRAHPELDPVSRDAILSGQVWEGMLADEVIASLGEPTQVEAGTGTTERWVYPGEQNLPLTFLYFEEGILTHASH